MISSFILITLLSVSLASNAKKRSKDSVKTSGSLRKTPVKEPITPFSTSEELQESPRNDLLFSVLGMQSAFYRTALAHSKMLPLFCNKRRFQVRFYEAIRDVNAVHGTVENTKQLKTLTLSKKLLDKAVAAFKPFADRYHDEMNDLIHFAHSAARDRSSATTPRMIKALNDSVKSIVEVNEATKSFDNVRGHRDRGLKVLSALKARAAYLHKSQELVEAEKLERQMLWVVQRASDHLMRTNALLLHIASSVIEAAVEEFGHFLINPPSSYHMENFYAMTTEACQCGGEYVETPTFKN